jgi:DivIVA domain-containing protein
MEVSPKTFREVEFREKMRGYHPEDVDQFLEQMAAGVEVLQDRLRQAVERAQRAEQVASEAGSSDETLRRTLVLAQRTADLAVQEAREQAARILAAAEQQAQGLVADAEERARRLHGEALADVHAELAKLETIRAQSQQEVDALTRWAEEHRTHLATTLQDALAMIDRAGLLAPAPTSTPIDLPAPPARPPAPVARREAPPAEAPAPVSQIAPAPEPEAPSAPMADPTEAVAAPIPDGQGQREDFGDGPDDEALDSFFDETDFGDERRFGGRLRRRR